MKTPKCIIKMAKERLAINETWLSSNSTSAIASNEFLWLVEQQTVELKAWLKEQDMRDDSI
jgi:hypothetical protein